MTISYENKSQSGSAEANEPPNVFRCHLGIILEDGVYSVIVLNLPGIGSFGDTEDEAIASTKEAIAGAIESYEAAQEQIPWLDIREYAIPDGAKVKWILVNG
jgi:predicted RNase H-like HicB family nuclease